MPQLARYVGNLDSCIPLSMPGTTPVVLSALELLDVDLRPLHIAADDAGNRSPIDERRTGLPCHVEHLFEADFIAWFEQSVLM